VNPVVTGGRGGKILEAISKRKGKKGKEESAKKRGTGLSDLINLKELRCHNRKKRHKQG